MLELGRRVIMGFSIDCRSDLSELKATYPHEAAEFERLRIEIDTSSPGLGMSYNETARHQRLIREFEDKITTIRGFPGHQRFLLPPLAEDLMKVVAEGPILLLNCSPYRSDAIIVTSTDIITLELPKL
jgi:hypothetical protein